MKFVAAGLAAAFLMTTGLAHADPAPDATAAKKAAPATGPNSGARARNLRSNVARPAPLNKAAKPTKGVVLPRPGVSPMPGTVFHQNAKKANADTVKH